MTKLPRVKGQEFIAALRRAGFEVIRVKGSHHFLRHPHGRCAVIPVHRGEVIGPGLLFKNMHDCEMTAMSWKNFCESINGIFLHREFRLISTSSRSAPLARLQRLSHKPLGAIFLH